MRLSLLLCTLPTISAAFVAPQVTRTKSKAGALFLARRAKGADDASSSSKMSPAKKAALDGVLQKIERSYGRGSIVKLGDAENMVVDSIGSGALTLGESSLAPYLDCCGQRKTHSFYRY